MSNIRKVVVLSLLTAVSVIIFVLEAQIPSFIPIPGVKLGLSNVVSLSVLLLFGFWDSSAVILIRCFLGSLLSGQLSALPYSLTGGFLALIVMWSLHKIIKENQIFILSAIGAIFHNVGQICMACIITDTPGLVMYLPILLISGIMTGLFTGFTVQFFQPKLKKAMKINPVSS